MQSSPPSRMFDAAWFNRHRAKLLGFFFGLALPLVIVGLFAAMQGGGLSDSAVIEPSPYLDL